MQEVWQTVAKGRRMSLPKWIEDMKGDIHREDSCDWAFKGLLIAWEALERIANPELESRTPGGIAYDAQEALRRIEDLGKYNL